MSGLLCKYRCYLEPSQMNAFRESVTGDRDEKQSRRSPASQNICQQSYKAPGEEERGSREGGQQESFRKAMFQKGQGDNWVDYS